MRFLLSQNMVKTTVMHEVPFVSEHGTDNSVMYEVPFVSEHDTEAENLEGGKYIDVVKTVDNFVTC